MSFQFWLLLEVQFQAAHFFSSVLFSQVRCLLQGGANVVRCTTVLGPSIKGMCIVGASLVVDQFWEFFLNHLLNHQFVAWAATGDGSVLHLVQR